MFRGEARGLPGLQEEKVPLCRLLKRLLGGDGGSWQAPRAKQRRSAGPGAGSEKLTSCGSCGPWLGAHLPAPRKEGIRLGSAPVWGPLPGPPLHPLTWRSCSCWIIFS